MNGRHTLTSGRTRSGKTYEIVNRLLKEAEKTDPPTITFVCPHPQAGELFISELYARFGNLILPRLLVERISDSSKVVMRTLIKKSTATDYFQRRNENAVYCKNFMDMIGRRIGISNWAEHRVLQKYLRFDVQAYQDIDEWFPESLIPQFLVPKTAEWQFAVDHVKEERLFHGLMRISRMSEKDQLYHTEPVVRILEDFLGNAAMEARTSKPQTWDRIAFHNEGGIQVILGEDGYEDALSTLVSSDFQESCSLLKNGLVHKPMHYAIDEGTSAGLIGWYESRAVSTMAGFGMFISFLVQSFDFPTPEIKRNILQNTDHLWFNCGDWEMAMEGARDLLGSLDEYKVHHKTKKQVHAGFSYETRDSVGRSVGPLGDDRKTVTTSQVAVPQYETIEEESFQPGSEQIIWRAQDLQELSERTCWERPMGRAPALRTVDYLEDSWAFPAIPEMGIEALSTIKVRECLQLLKTKTIYETPVKPELPKTTSFPQSNGMAGAKASSRKTRLRQNSLSQSKFSRANQKPANGSASSNRRGGQNGQRR